jgi:hypothetical protein
MRRFIWILSLLVAAFAIFAQLQGASAAATPALPPCTAYQSPTHVGVDCRHIFVVNQAVSIAPQVYFAWLRSAPSSDASFKFTVYSFNQPALRILKYPPVWDGRQWWWELRAVANAQFHGWVEQASLTSGTIRATPVPTKVVTTYAAYQPFQNGYMLWTSNDERIYVFTSLYYAGDVTWSYALSDYQASSEVVSDSPPPGLVKPIRGFARVWNLEKKGNPQSSFGWATAPEVGITATLSIRTEYDPFRSTPVVYVEKFQLSNGKTFSVTRGRSFYWSLRP